MRMRKQTHIIDSLKILLFTAFWVITFTFWYCFIVITVVDYISPSSFWSYQWKFTDSKFFVQPDLYIHTNNQEDSESNGERRETQIQEVNRIVKTNEFRCFSNCLGESVWSGLVKQEDAMHLLSPVFAFIVIQLGARGLDLTLHNNTLIHTNGLVTKKISLRINNTIHLGYDLLDLAKYQLVQQLFTSYRYLQSMRENKIRQTSPAIGICHILDTVICFWNTLDQEHININVVYAVKQLRGRRRRMLWFLQCLVSQVMYGYA